MIDHAELYTWSQNVANLINAVASLKEYDAEYWRRTEYMDDYDHDKVRAVLEAAEPILCKVRAVAP